VHGVTPNGIGRAIRRSIYFGNGAGLLLYNDYYFYPTSLCIVPPTPFATLNIAPHHIVFDDPR
jgi:hypothetical protein